MRWCVRALGTLVSGGLAACSPCEPVPVVSGGTTGHREAISEAIAAFHAFSTGSVCLRGANLVDPDDLPAPEDVMAEGAYTPNRTMYLSTDAPTDGPGLDVIVWHELAHGWADQVGNAWDDEAFDVSPDTFPFLEGRDALREESFAFTVELGPDGLALALAHAEACAVDDRVASLEIVRDEVFVPAGDRGPAVALGPVATFVAPEGRTFFSGSAFVDESVLSVVAGVDDRDVQGQRVAFDLPTAGCAVAPSEAVEAAGVAGWRVIEALGAEQGLVVRAFEGTDRGFGDRWALSVHVDGEERPLTGVCPRGDVVLAAGRSVWVLDIEPERLRAWPLVWTDGRCDAP